MLNQRLLACAGFVQGNFICDVGTDHALLPVYLVKNQIVQQALACDIRKGPLQAAESNINRAGLADKIRMILSDGLLNVPPEGVTDIIIAGMGGETIIHILETCPFSLEKINLIFQPMTKAELLRKWLYENGFAIRKEICIPDKKFLYAVMQVRFTGNVIIPDGKEIYFGKMNLSDENGLAYAKNQVAQLIRIRMERYFREGKNPPSELNDSINSMLIAIKEYDKK
ncbi:MAG: SAM-dependent methyltransferase [Oscillospiraceae bacterium]|nr:SAM-dependent methyltransferase [Oscillospiraceae bacterium]